MTVQFKVEKRKELVKAIEELTLEKAKYQGVPSCAYQIGGLTLSKDSALSWGKGVNEKAVQNLVKRLTESGFKIVQDKQEPEIIGVTIAMPMSLFTPEAWENLNAILAAKGKLIKDALGLDELPEAVEEDGNATFPWFRAEMKDAELIDAYGKFVCALCKMARTQKRVTAKEKPVENEKFAFRCFLLRLGFIGKEYKTVRKVLLRNLTGSAAFKGGARNGNSK